jgi:hypothetical protein
MWCCEITAIFRPHRGRRPAVRWQSVRHESMRRCERSDRAREVAGEWHEMPIRARCGGLGGLVVYVSPPRKARCAGQLIWSTVPSAQSEAVMSKRCRSGRLGLSLFMNKRSVGSLELSLWMNKRSAGSLELSLWTNKRSAGFSRKPRGRARRRRWGVEGSRSRKSGSCDRRRSKS